MSDEATRGRKLIVLGLGYSVEDVEFRQFFDRFGTVEDSVVLKDFQTGTSRGFGFVTYADPESAQRVLTEHQTSGPLEIGGKRIDPQLAIPKGQLPGGGPRGPPRGPAPYAAPQYNNAPQYNAPQYHAPAPYQPAPQYNAPPPPQNGGSSLPPAAEMITSRVFVGKLAFELSSTDVQQYFETFGPVTDCYMPRDFNTQQSRGIAFVTFESPQIVDQVMQMPHVIAGRPIAVDKAAPRKEGGGKGGGRGGGRGPPPQQAYADPNAYSYQPPQGQGYQNQGYAPPAQGYSQGWAGATNSGGPMPTAHGRGGYSPYARPSY